jgi:hypothetical protein
VYSVTCCWLYIIRNLGILYVLQEKYYVSISQGRNVIIIVIIFIEELDGPAVSALRRAIAEVKQRWSVIGWVTKYYLDLLRASEGKLSRWPRLHLQSLAPTNPHWAHVVGYGPFFLCVFHKEGLCPSSGDINRL